MTKYLCWNNYWATGEGRHVCLSLELASSSEEAEGRFYGRFHNSVMESADTNVLPLYTPQTLQKAEYILTTFFSPAIVESILKDGCFEGFTQFSFQFDFNLT